MTAAQLPSRAIRRLITSGHGFHGTGITLFITAGVSTAKRRWSMPSFGSGMVLFPKWCASSLDLAIRSGCPGSARTDRRPGRRMARRLPGWSPRTQSRGGKDSSGSCCSSRATEASRDACRWPIWDSDGSPPWHGGDEQRHRPNRQNQPITAVHRRWIATVAVRPVGTGAISLHPHFSRRRAWL